MYKYDAKISTVYGSADWTPQPCLIWLQVGSYWRLLAVICSVLFFDSSFSAFCTIGCVSNYCLGFLTCIWFKETDTNTKEAKSGNRNCWHYLHVLRVRTTVPSSAAWKTIHIGKAKGLIKEQGETGFSSGLIRNYWPKLQLLTHSRPHPQL